MIELDGVWRRANIRGEATNAPALQAPYSPLPVPVSALLSRLDSNPLNMDADSRARNATKLELFAAVDS